MLFLLVHVCMAIYVHLVCFPICPCSLNIQSIISERKLCKFQNNAFRLVPEKCEAIACYASSQTASDIYMQHLKTLFESGEPDQKVQQISFLLESTFSTHYPTARPRS